MTSAEKKSLAQKLGLKPGLSAAVVRAPEKYLREIGGATADIKTIAADSDITSLHKQLDFIHLFTRERTVLEKTFPELKEALAPDGALWVSWPKASALMGSGPAPDINENVVREVGLTNGLVDVKVVSVDETWSALKFVYRLADRGPSDKKRA